MSNSYSNADSASTNTAVTDGMDRAIAAGAETARSAAKSITATAKDVSEKAMAAKDAVSQFVEARPLTSVLIALGLGVLLSRSISRR